MKLLIHTLFASLLLTTFSAAESYDCKFKVRANDRKWIPTSLSIDVDRNDRVWVLGNVIKTDAGRAIEGRETDIIRTRDVFEVETANENMPVDSPQTNCRRCAARSLYRFHRPQKSNRQSQSGNYSAAFRSVPSRRWDLQNSVKCKECFAITFLTLSEYGVYNE